MYEWFINFIISVVISWLLTEDEEDLEQQDGVLLNKQSNIAPIPIIYGNRKVGGIRVFVETSGVENEYLYIALVLCEGEIQSIGNVWINDVLSTDSKFSGLVVINKHVGTDSQTADTTLTGAPSWTTDHKLSGVAYLGIRLKWDRDVFGSVPMIQADVLGRKVYDPRNGSTAYSQNPALCLLDYMTNTRYGKGLPSTAFESGYSSWKTSADICDINVTPYSGGSTIDTFSCNAVMSTEHSLMNNVKVFMSGMRGLITYTQGVYKLIIETAGTPTFAFTESHIVEGISFEGERRNNKYNRVIATFTNPEKNWQDDQVEYPDAGSSEYTTYLSEDGGFDLESRVTLPTITNVYQAKHMAQSILKRSRDGIRCSFLSTAEALQVAVGDIVSVTHRTPAWNAKPFRVIELSLKADGNVVVALSEHQDSIYSWASSTELPSYPDTNLPNPYSATAPTSLTISSGENYQVTNNDGSTSPRIYVAWTASTDSFVDYYVIQARIAGGTPSENPWDIEHTTDNTPLYISGVASGTTIDVRIKSVNAMGVSSTWVQVDNHAIAVLVGGGSGGTTTFSQTSAPTADLEEGDIWFDTDDSNKMYRYEGSPLAWVAKTGTLASIDIPPTLATITPSAGTLTSGTLQVGSGGITIIGGTAGGSRLEITNETLTVYDGSTLRLKIGKL